MNIRQAMKRSSSTFRPAMSSIVLMLGLMCVPDATAQIGYQTIDPFYQDELARRDFFSNVAVSGEIGYRTTSLLQPGSDATTGLGSVAVSAQLEYALMQQVDVAAIVDLTGGVGPGTLGLSWLVVKPYWHNNGTDYAVRIAVDPASEGSLGFRQTDVAFLSTSASSPSVISTFAVGVRRVRAGYENGTSEIVPDPASFGASADFLASTDRTRVIGRELHVAWGYNFLFDPAASRISLSLLGEAGDYTLLRREAEEPGVSAEDESESRIRSGMAWLRGGIELNRPSYQLAPYVSIPIATWANVEGQSVRHGPRPDKAQFGVRVTLR